MISETQGPDGTGNKAEKTALASNVNDVNATGKAVSPKTESNEPKPASQFEVMLITGMSGAGRSHAADCVEDMGWYVVDNLPPKLLIPLVDMMTSSGSKVHKLAAVIDVRSRSYFDDLSAVLSHLDDLGVRTHILFLDASDKVLVQRYESVRRPHPLQHGNRLIDGIREERELLENLKERADTVIDTSALSIHQLSTKLYEALLGSGAKPFPSTSSVSVSNTGFRSTRISSPTSGSCLIPIGCRACVNSTATIRPSAIMFFVTSEPRNSLTPMRKPSWWPSRVTLRKISIMSQLLSAAPAGSIVPLRSAMNWRNDSGLTG